MGLGDAVTELVTVWNMTLPELMGVGDGVAMIFERVKTMVVVTVNVSKLSSAGAPLGSAGAEVIADAEAEAVVDAEEMDPLMVVLAPEEALGSTPAGTSVGVEPTPFKDEVEVAVGMVPVKVFRPMEVVVVSGATAGAASALRRASGTLGPGKG